MKKQLLKDSFGWGIALWLIGYALGIVFFFILPPHLIGWAITPIGVALTLWVLFKKVQGDQLKYYFIVAFAWTIIAVVLDYFFIVQALHPTDGYYKLDVYLYYAFTFFLPVIVGVWKTTKSSKAHS